MAITHYIQPESTGFVSSHQLMESGNYYKALRAVERGELIKVRHGIYALPESLVSNMVDIEKIVPSGVLCLYSAWYYYGLTDTVPPAICVAIEAKRKVVAPQIIPFQFYYWKIENLQFGITETEISGYHVRITDIERSVCDAIKYRNKIGMEVCAEIVRNYLSRKDRNISKLIEYSKRLRVYKTLSLFFDITLV